MNFVEETLGEIVDKACDKFADREAIVFADDGSRLSYGEFQQMYLALAKSLHRLGVRKGQHIAVMAINSPRWLALQIAAAKIGAVLVWLNTAYTAHEIEYALTHTEAIAIFFEGKRHGASFLDVFQEICPELKDATPQNLKCARLPDLKTVVCVDAAPADGVTSFHDFLKQGESVADDTLEKIAATLFCKDVINIQFTSGTTGNPKAVMATHYSIVNGALIGGKNMRYTPADRILLCLPMFHVIGCVLSGILGILHGSSLVIVGRFQTEKVIECLEKEQCTVLNAVPTMFCYLLDSPRLSPDALTCLKKGFIAGSCCPPTLLEKIMCIMHMPELYVIYGQTESILISQTLVTDSLHHRLHTVGRAADGVQTKVVGVHQKSESGYEKSGELYVKTEYMMQGYYKNESATARAVDEDGWLHTGDWVSVDSKGYITLTGRIKDIIVRGGENISPAEIENTLKDFESVRDVAVIGVPDKMLGEEICAAIITDRPDVPIDALLSYAGERLAKYKIPQYVCFVDAFPMTASGKVKKHLLREQMIQQLHLGQSDTNLAQVI